MLNKSRILFVFSVLCLNYILGTSDDSTIAQGQYESIEVTSFGANSIMIYLQSGSLYNMRGMLLERSLSEKLDINRSTHRAVVIQEPETRVLSYVVTESIFAEVLSNYTVTVDCNSVKSAFKVMLQHPVLDKLFLRIIIHQLDQNTEELSARIDQATTILDLINMCTEGAYVNFEYSGKIVSVSSMNFAGMLSVYEAIWSSAFTKSDWTYEEIREFIRCKDEEIYCKIGLTPWLD